MKLIKKYLPGDKVFAKVRGYPPWPARVEEVIDGHTKNAKYNVVFYGTGETALCKVEELFSYHENKEKYGKHLKRKVFHEGMQQLEQELRNDQAHEQQTSPNKLTETETENSVSVVQTPNLDSDVEAGALVIDEGDKKRQLKRKSLATPLVGLDSSEPKKKRARGKGWSNAQNTSMQEIGTDSQGEEMVGKEVVSRSGRKIKPKRFADFSSSDEFDIETSGRSRGNKSKIDDSMESEVVLSSAVPQKQLNLEKDDKKLSATDRSMQQQKHQLRWLRMEHQLLTLDAQIKSNLGLDIADVDECMQAMDEILNLPIDPLMLKKHSHIVETVRQLRRYIGNVSEWKFEAEEMLTFKQKADHIRQKADQIYMKFKTMFTIPEGQTFWQFFFDQVNIFKESTKDMSEEKILALMCDPACPAETTIDNSFTISEGNMTEILTQSVIPSPTITDM